MIAPAALNSESLDTTSTSSAQEVIVAIPQTYSVLVRQVADLRNRIQRTSRDAAALQGQVNAKDLDRRTHFKVRQEVGSLLDELSGERGMSWNDIARCVGVSSQAVRKWRKGETATGENRLGLARLAALLDILSEMRIEDPGSWLEVPIVTGCPVNPLDLYAAGKVDLLLEWVDLRIDSGEDLLEMFDPSWRDKYTSSYETFRAGDGNLSVRRRQ